MILQEELDTRITFKKWGITKSSYLTKNLTSYVSYRDALASNGHDENTDIHYLKIDVEGAERDVSILYRLKAHLHRATQICVRRLGSYEAATHCCKGSYTAERSYCICYSPASVSPISLEDGPSSTCSVVSRCCLLFEEEVKK